MRGGIVMVMDRTTDGYMDGNEGRRGQRAVGAMIALVLLMPVAVAVLMVSRYATREPGLRQTTQGPQQPRVLSPEPLLADTSATSDEKPKVRQTRVRRSLPQNLATKSAVVSFPAATDIPIGMGRSTLLARFRKPDMKTTSVELGQPTKTWLYVQSDAARQTAVQLRSGKVVAVFEN